MAYQLTTTAQDKARLQKIEPSLVLQIEGYDKVFGVGTITKLHRVGDYGLRIGDDWVIGGSGPKEDNLKYISFDGTTSSLSSQIEQDKGGASSVSSIKISLVDQYETLTKLISPSFVLDDILGRRAYVYLGFAGSLYPEDYILIFNGNIDDVSSVGSKIMLNVANPQNNKRQKIFQVLESKLSANLTIGATTVFPDDVANFLEPYSTEFLTYVKIGDEIIRYTGVDTGTNSLTGCSRAQFGTIAATHAIGDSASQFYRLVGQSTQLALKIMLSGQQVYYLEDINITSFVTDTGGSSVSESIFFSSVNVVEKYGFSVGDFITVTGATESANNVTLKKIQSIEVTELGSRVVIEASGLVLETGTSAVLKIKSKYNVFPDGLGMGGDQVDVAEFERIETLFYGSIPEMDFYIKDTIDGKDFIDKEVLYPANMYTIPRQGKVSVGFISPPVSAGEIVVLDSTNIVDPDKVQIRRTTSKYFYNTYVVKYDYDAIEDKPLKGYILTDEDSKNQIRVGTKQITIESLGLRDNASTNTIIRSNSERFLDRYKFAAEQISCSVLYSVGFKIEVGDVVFFGDTRLSLTDTKNGARGFHPRLCEVVNKSMDIKQGRVDLVLIDTNYASTGRYGIFSPSTVIGSGSTSTDIVLTDSYGTTSPMIERDKWEQYIGKPIQIRDITYDNVYQTSIVEFVSDYVMRVVDIGVAPSAGYIIELPNYPADTNPDVQFTYKNTYCYFNPVIEVTSGTDDFNFDVTSVSDMFVGATILVRSSDWNTISNEVKIESIAGLTVTTDKTLGITPASGYFVELIGFPDEGQPYRWL